MKRVWLPMSRWVLLGIAMLVTLLVLVPMRLGFELLQLRDQRVAARAISGSLWGGTIQELHVGMVPIGTVNAALSPIQLLVGRARLDLHRHAGGLADVDGAISVSRNGFGIDDATLSLPMAGALAPLPIASLDLSDVSVRFVDGACERARGQVRARLAGTVAGLALAQGFAGPVICAGREVRLPLASQAGTARLDLRIAADGGYHADVIVAEPDPTLGTALEAYGFQRVPAGYRLRATGRFG